MNRDAEIYQEYLQKMKEHDEKYAFLRKELWLEWVEERYYENLEKERKKENRNNNIFSFILGFIVFLLFMSK